MRTAELKQLKLLASRLPVIPLRRHGDKWVRQATNHESRIIKAYKEGGQTAVVQYIGKYKAECLAYQQMIDSLQNGDDNIINLNNQQP